MTQTWSEADVEDLWLLQPDEISLLPGRFDKSRLGSAGCKKLFDDKVSGSRADRPGLSKALEMLREGDTLVVWKLDR
ncbi:recombinase family protein, partial [Pseudomonas savastanoi]|uniref:recombinase family protein n=1 Tax=Pseudomonas savastanoi TaxID=29438 RepID=UPI00210E5021